MNTVPERDASLQDLEPWRTVWRRGIAPQFRTGALVTLAEALRADSVALLQGATTDPRPLQCHGKDEPCRACVIGFLAMVEGAETVAEVEERFADACFRTDRLLGEPTAVRRFLNWFDDTSREIVFPALLAEVEAELVARAVAMPSGVHSNPAV